MRLPRSAHDNGKGYKVDLTLGMRLFDLADILRKIALPLMTASVPHELVGGLAVLVHVEHCAAKHSVQPHNVDLMIQRSDLRWAREIAAQQGFYFRQYGGQDLLLLPGDAPLASNVVHLIYSGEKVRPDQAEPNPSIQPERKRWLGVEMFVIGVADLVRMKLSAFRDKDRLHVRSLDAGGLITPEVERTLGPELWARLQYARHSEERGPAV